MNGRVQTLHSAPKGCLLMRMYLHAEVSVSSVPSLELMRRALTGWVRGRRCTATGSRSSRSLPCSSRPWAASWRLRGARRARVEVGEAEEEEEGCSWAAVRDGVE